MIDIFIAYKYTTDPKNACNACLARRCVIEMLDGLGMDIFIFILIKVPLATSHPQNTQVMSNQIIYPGVHY